MPQQLLKTCISACNDSKAVNNILCLILTPFTFKYMSLVFIETIMSGIDF